MCSYCWLQRAFLYSVDTCPFLALWLTDICCQFVALLLLLHLFLLPLPFLLPFPNIISLVLRLGNIKCCSYLWSLIVILGGEQHGTAEYNEDSLVLSLSTAETRYLPPWVSISSFIPCKKENIKPDNLGILPVLIYVIL